LPASRRALGLVITCVLTAAAVAAAVAQADAWVADRYGWRGSIEPLQATTDGGRHWKTIWDDGQDLSDFAQTAPGVGAVATGDPGGIDQAWTTDNGRHWYLLDGSSDFERYQGHGGFLFWTEQPQGTTDAVVHQVVPWPARGKYLRCGKGGFGRQPAGGPLCNVPAHPLRSIRIVTLPNAITNDVRNVPGGIAAVFGRGVGAADEPLFRVFVRHNGLSRVVGLPAVPAAVEAAFEHSGGAALGGDWPDLTVTAVSAGDSTDGNVGATALWSSGDGGRTWTLVQAATAP
jgi:hypothetical protein